MRKILNIITLFLLVSMVCFVMSTFAATHRMPERSVSRAYLMLAQYSGSTLYKLPKTYSFEQKNQLENKVRNFIRIYDQKIYRLARKPQTYDVRTQLNAARNTRKNLHFRLEDITNAHEGNWERVERMTQQTLKSIQKRH